MIAAIFVGAGVGRKVVIVVDIFLWFFYVCFCGFICEVWVFVILGFVVIIFVSWASLGYCGYFRVFCALLFGVKGVFRLSFVKVINGMKK